MFSILSQRNKYTTFDFLPGIGLVLLILIHDRKFICHFGTWYEVIPTVYNGPFTSRAYTYKPPKHVRRIKSRAEKGKRRLEEKLKKSIEAVEQAFREAEWLEVTKRDSGWTEGYTYEEEKEPVLEFMKQREETDERIKQSLEFEENYVISCFDFH